MCFRACSLFPVNMGIYQDGGVGEASLEYMKAVKQELFG
jgi:hypothetical protein